MLAEAKTQRGKLRAWWKDKYQTQQSVPFEQRTLGGLIREYYEDAAIELTRLRGKLSAEGHDPDVEVRITELERLFSDADTDLQALNAEESLDNWHVARSTGDSLADQWEQQIARGEVPDMDEES